MPRDDDDTPPTPVQTPSARHRLGLATCPCCEGSRVRGGEDCTFCKVDGGTSSGHVSLEKAGEWFGLTPVVKK
jgi:hypothetical protein